MYRNKEKLHEIKYSMLTVHNAQPLYCQYKDAFYSQFHFEQKIFIFRSLRLAINIAAMNLVCCSHIFDTLKNILEMKRKNGKEVLGTSYISWKKPTISYLATFLLVQ